MCMMVMVDRARLGEMVDAALGRGTKSRSEDRVHLHHNQKMRPSLNSPGYPGRTAIPLLARSAGCTGQWRQEQETRGASQFWID